MNPSLSLISVVTLVVLLLACISPKLSSDRNELVGQQTDIGNTANLLQNDLSSNIKARENDMANSKGRNAALDSLKYQVGCNIMQAGKNSVVYFHLQ